MADWTWNGTPVTVGLDWSVTVPPKPQPQPRAVGPVRRCVLTVLTVSPRPPRASKPKAWIYDRRNQPVNITYHAPGAFGHEVANAAAAAMRSLSAC